MSGPGLFYWQDRLGKTMPHIVRFTYDITAAVTFSEATMGYPVMAFTTARSQPVIDAFLGTSSEFTAAQFDATAMGADTFGVLVNMGGATGQGYQLVYALAKCYSNTGNVDQVERISRGTGLTDSTLSTQSAIGAYGNFGARWDFGNSPDFDGLTAGIIRVELAFISK